MTTNGRGRPRQATPSTNTNPADAAEFTAQPTDDLWHLPDVVADVWAALSLARHQREVAR